MSALSARAQFLRENLADAPEVIFTYFKPDERKAGGAYLTTTGTVKKLDDYEHQIVLQDGMKPPMNEILNISGEIFVMIE